MSIVDDARRYRWLREHAFIDLSCGPRRIPWEPELLDAAVDAAIIGREVTPVHLELSYRELDVFKRVAIGQTIKAIGSDLALSHKTVATYMARIHEKTGLMSPVAIARYALKAGLVD